MKVFQTSVAPYVGYLVVVYQLNSSTCFGAHLGASSFLGKSGGGGGGGFGCGVCWAKGVRGVLGVLNVVNLINITNP